MFGLCLRRRDRRGTCHDTPNVGNHSSPTPLDIGTGDPSPSKHSANLGGLDIGYLPSITVCKTDPATGLSTNNCKTTTDLGQGLIDGNFDHVGKIKGPILRGLSARAPYFHNGSAQTLLDAVHFYETRFGLVLTLRRNRTWLPFYARFSLGPRFGGTCGARAWASSSDLP